MKTSRSPLPSGRPAYRILAPAFAALTLLAASAQAQSLSWTAAGNSTLGGAGTWDTSSSLWWNGSSATTWGNTATSDAVFAGTAGTVTLGEALNANDITFNTSGYILSGDQTLTLAGTTPTINVGTGLSATIGDNTALVLDGISGLTKSGLGTLTINGTTANTFTGGVNVNGGTLALNFQNMVTPTNLIASTNTLTLDGGNLTVTGTSGTTSQTFASTSFNSGTSTIRAINSGGTSTTINLGNLSVNQPGSVVFLNGTGGFGATVSTVERIFVSGATTNAWLAPWAFTGNPVDGTLRWAFVDTTGQIRQNFGDSAGTNMASVTNATRVYTVTGTATLGATATALGIQGNGPSTYNLGNFNLTTGGLIQLQGVTTTVQTTGSGQLRGDANGFLITGGNSTGNINITAPIADGAVATNLTHIGAGTLTLGGANVYTGQTTLNGGTMVIGSGGTINSSSGVVINGGTFRYNNTSTALNPAITLNGGTLTGTGAVMLGAVTVANNAGAIITNNNGAAGAALTVGSLAFNGAATINLFLNSTSPALIAAGLSTNAAGQVLITPVSNTGLWSTGSTYSLLSYTGGSIGGAGFGQFNLGTVTGLTSRQSTLFGDSGSAITLTINGDNPYWTGGTNGDWNTTQTGNWKLVSAGTDTEFIEGDEVHFTDAATGTTNVNITENVSTTAVLFNNSSQDYTIGSTGGFGITSAVSVTKNGTGTVTLSSTNTYSGATTINEGTLRVQGGSAIGDASVVTLGDVASATLDVQASETIGGLSGGGATGGNVNISAGQVLTLGGSTAQTFGGALTGDGGLTLSGSANQTLTGAITYAGDTVLNSGTRLTINRSDTVNFNSVLTGSGTLALTGSGSVVFGSSNTFNGTVALSGVSTTTFDLGNQNQTIGALFGGNQTGTVALGSGNLTITAATNQTYNGFFTGTGDIIVNAASPSATVSFAGDGTAKSTAFTGNIRVQAGTMILGKTSDIFGTNSSGLGTQSIFVSNGATARLAYGNAAYVQNQNFVLNGTGSDGNGALQALAMNFGNAAIGGIIAETDSLVRVTRDGSDAATRTLLVRNSLAGSGNLTFNGGGGSKPGFIQLNVASGNLTLGGTTYETYSGHLAVTGNATLISNAANALGNAQSLTVDANSTTTFNSVATQTIGGLAGAGTVNINGSTLTVGAGNTTSSFSGVIQNTSGNGSLTKTGTGSQTLSGINAYTGNTTVTSGSLLITGSGTIGASNLVLDGGIFNVSGITGTEFTMTSSQSVTGNGTIVTTGKNLVLEGTLAPGATLGTINVTGDFTLASTAVANFTIDGITIGDFDRLLATGVLTYGGTLNLNTSYAAQVGDSVKLFDGSSFGGSFSSITGTDLGGGKSWDTSTLATDGTITVVPEPATSLLVGLGLAGVAVLRRRRR